MARSETLLTINPLFYDALSGEFTTGDSLQQHTLGRLAVATFTKGAEPAHIDGPNMNSDMFYEVSYRPSWAQDIEARVFCVEKLKRAVLQEVILKRDGSNAQDRLRISDDSVANPAEGILRIFRPGTYAHELLPLELGVPVVAARGAVAQAVQEFLAS